MQKKKAVIFDIDSTIAEISHRIFFKHDREKFYNMSINDRPILPIIDILNRYLADSEYTVILLTARPNKYRDITQEWLMKNISLKYNNCILIMRNNDDMRPDYQIKKSIYKNNLQEKFDIQCVFEDRKRVVDMWRSMGILCLQNCNGNY